MKWIGARSEKLGHFLSHWVDKMDPDPSVIVLVEDPENTYFGDAVSEAVAAQVPSKSDEEARSSPEAPVRVSSPKRVRRVDDSEFDSKDVSSSSSDGHISEVSDNDSPISESVSDDAVSDALLGDELFLQNCKKALISVKKILNKDQDKYCESVVLCKIDDDMVTDFAGWVMESYMESGIEEPEDK